MFSVSQLEPVSASQLPLEAAVPKVAFQFTFTSLPHLEPQQRRCVLRDVSFDEYHGVQDLDLIIQGLLLDLIPDSTRATLPRFERTYDPDADTQYALDGELYGKLMQAMVSGPSVYLRIASTIKLPRFGHPLPVTVRVLLSAQPSQPALAPRPEVAATGDVSRSSLTAMALNNLAVQGSKPAAVLAPPLHQQPVRATAMTVALLTPSMPRGTFSVEGVILDCVVKPNGVLEATLYQAELSMATPTAQSYATNRISVVCFDAATVRSLDRVVQRGRRLRLELVTVIPKTEADVRFQCNVHPCKIVVDRHSLVVDLGVSAAGSMPPAVAESVVHQPHAAAAGAGAVGFMRRASGNDLGATGGRSGAAFHTAAQGMRFAAVGTDVAALNAAQLRLMGAAPGFGPASGLGGSGGTITIGSLSSGCPVGPTRTRFVPTMTGTSSGGSSSALSHSNFTNASSLGSVNNTDVEALDIHATRGDVTRRDAVLEARSRPTAPKRPKTRQCIFCRYDLTNEESLSALMKRISETPAHTHSGKASFQYTRETAIAKFADPRPGPSFGRAECRTVLRDPVSEQPFIAHPRCAHITTSYQLTGQLDDVCSSRDRCSKCHRQDALVQCYEPTCKSIFCIVCALFSENLVDFGRHDPVNPSCACPSHAQIIMPGSTEAKRNRAEDGVQSRKKKDAGTLFDSSVTTGWARDPDEDDTHGRP
jgi:hypothetical protein